MDIIIMPDETMQNQEDKENERVFNNPWTGIHNVYMYVHVYKA